MNPALRIRRARADDASTLYRFVQRLAEHSGRPNAVEVTPETLRSQLSSSSPPFECLIAELEGAAVGFALFFSTYSTWRGRPGIYLEDLFVAPDARHRGVGKALLARLAALAIDRGCARLEWAVIDSNEPALRFYRSVGATALDLSTIHRLTDDALVRLAEADG